MTDLREFDRLLREARFQMRQIMGLKQALDDIVAGAGGVPNSRTVNGHALSSDVTVSKADVGLGNCDNTSDANKPISTATQSALDLKEGSLGFTAIPNTRTVNGKALSSDIVIPTGVLTDPLGTTLTPTAPPAASGFSAINVGSHTTLIDSGAGLLFQQMGINGTGTTYTAEVMAIPVSGAYSLTVGLEIALLHPTNYSFMGIVVTDGNGSTPKGTYIALQSGLGTSVYNLAVGVGNITFPATLSGSALYGQAATPPWTKGLLFLRIRDDRSSTIYFESSPDNVNWQTIYSYARTSWMIPAYAGLFIGQASVAMPTTWIRGLMKVFHWTLA